MNTQKPIWLRPPRDVEDAEYGEFYKSAFKAYDSPLAHSHFSLEGSLELKALLYVPSMLPFEMSRDMFGSEGGMKLYIKRVFISDKMEVRGEGGGWKREGIKGVCACVCVGRREVRPVCLVTRGPISPVRRSALFACNPSSLPTPPQILPRWLSFVRAVVDSDDLELNVSREILQEGKVLRVIRKRLVRKCLDMIAGIEGDDGKTFWEQFGKYVKVGLVEDDDNQEEIAGLCRWDTDKGEARSLKEYKEGMVDGQEKIYYVSGDSRAQCEMNPAMEGLKKKGYECVFATEPLDEISLQVRKKRR